MRGEVILVAVDASKEINSDHALEWAIQNVIKAEDILVLLAVLPSCGPPTPTLNKRIQSRVYNFLHCGARHNEGRSPFDQSKRDISHKTNYIYARKMQQLWLANNLMQVHYKVKVILDASLGTVAIKAKELKASWVILDRLLNKEASHCINELNCNVVLIDHAIPRIVKTVNPLATENFSENRIQSKPAERDTLHVIPKILDYKSVSTPSTSAMRSSIFGTHSFSLPSTDTEYQCKTNPCTINDSHAFLHLNSKYFNQDFEYLEVLNPSHSDIKYRDSDSIDELNHKSATNPLQGEEENYSNISRTKSSERKHYFERVANVGRRITDSSSMWPGQCPIQPKTPLTRRDSMPSFNKHESLSSPSATADRNSIIAHAMPLSITNPPNRSALCCICKQKPLVFRNVPRRFTYREIKNATGGFSDCNFMAEGGYGYVYRGKLPHGHVIAVKQCKKLKSFAASEFCLEVETLSCAQHRNLLMLVGYCIDTEWLLIYEFACNGSLDKHLYGTETNQVMAWHDRMKVAVGIAKGLRYLHEDCRVGCIVHGDLKPNNILLAHDFEPMIGDFGLARWKVNAELAEETRLIGKFGYLAPEYIQTGQVSEKADVYAFGVILLELLTGCRALNLSRKTSKQSLSEWGNTMLEKKKSNELIDSRLNDNYVEKEVHSMMHAAYLCISPHPEQRPRMSQVLKILEGDLPVNGTLMYQMSNTFNNVSVGSNKHWKDHMKLSQSNNNVNSALDSASNIPRYSSQIGENDITWESESVTNLDYESYLRGSLAKFVQNLN